ncbi:hypothetical protein L208DRAFT_1315739 [Tricholoma matsutake]|nr:hypothetical protein L208DRAFT_1315739 [Tricholoma matsutake 945]
MLTSILKLISDRDARLAQQRKLLLRGTAHCPIYITPIFPAFSSFDILDHVHVSASSCCEGPAVLPSLPSASCIDDLQVIVPVFPILAVPSFETPCVLYHALGSSSLLHYLLFFLLLSLLINSTVAMPTYAQSELSVCALNTNGLMSPVKLAFVGPLLMKIAPHFFALSETKTWTKAASNLPISNYEVFEEKAVPCTAPSHLAKWGIILGVQKDLQIVACVPLNHEPLKGRVMCVDVVVPSLSSSSTSFIHHVFSVYAPCDPGADDLSLKFWPWLTDMVQELKTSWSLFGDLNATVASFECTSDNALVRHTFNEFLRNTCGTDLWQRSTDRNRFIDWMCRSWHSTDGGSIIDRVVVSSHCLLDSEITTDPT